MSLNPTGQIQYFRSKTDDKLHPYAVCATDDSDEAKPVVLEVSPDAISDLPEALRITEEIAAVAANKGRSCIALRPTGCGPGSLYQNYGEVDLLEAIDHADSIYPIDRDRITIMGGSMGGAATWYLVSHYPDVFAAAAPFCGYCDYRLWEKPGGITFHMNEWEQPSWRSRSAVFLVENLQHTPVWIGHGEWDRSIGAWVSVEHSRQMASLLDEAGYSYRYTEVPESGHMSAKQAGIRDEMVLWLLGQRKNQNPGHVRLVTYSLRHNQSYWVTIDQLARYGDRGMIDAEAIDGTRLSANTDGVRAFSLGPVAGRGTLPVVVDGQDLGVVDLRRKQTFRRTDSSKWEITQREPLAEKRHGASGPIGDLFFDRTILVPGTAGSKEETHFNYEVALVTVIKFHATNGGVHRGGIRGENSVDLAVISDVDLTEEDLLNNNLLLYGSHASNSVLARLGPDLPLAFDGTTIHLSDQSYSADRAAVFAIFPHPRNPTRYVAVHSGVTADAISWGSHLGMQLLPDYLVYSQDHVLAWGFWDNDWKTQS